MESTAPVSLWVKGAGEREGDNRLRALRATRPHTVGCTGECDQEPSEELFETVCLARSLLKRFRRPILPKERVLDLQPTGLNPLDHRDD